MQKWGSGGLYLNELVVSRTVSHSMSACSPEALMPLASILRQEFIKRAVAVGLAPPSSPTEAQPNTDVQIALYDVESFPAAPSPLNADSWFLLMDGYPGGLRDEIHGMIKHGAKLGYERSDTLRRRSRRLERNLPMTEGGYAHVEKEIGERLSSGCVVTAEGNDHLITSPLGAVPKLTLDGVEK